MHDTDARQPEAQTRGVTALQLTVAGALSAATLVALMLHAAWSAHLPPPHVAADDAATYAVESPEISPGP